MAYGYVVELPEDVEHERVCFGNRYGIAIAADFPQRDAQMRKGRLLVIALAIVSVLAFGGCAAVSASSPSEYPASQGDMASAASNASESSTASPASDVAANEQSQALASGASPSESRVLEMSVNGASLYATLAETPAADELAGRLADGPVTVSLRDYGGFEKVGPLPWELPSTDGWVDGLPGDILLYRGSQVTIFYGSNSYSYTRLAHVDDATWDSLLAVLGGSDIEVTLSLA